VSPVLGSRAKLKKVSEIKINITVYNFEAGNQIVKKAP
jgi:hypothetical protein